MSKNAYFKISQIGCRRERERLADGEGNISTLAVLTLSVEQSFSDSCLTVISDSYQTIC